MVVRGWSQGALGQREAALASAAAARAVLGNGLDTALLNLVDDIDAWLAHAGGEYELAIARGQAVAARPGSMLEPDLLSVTLSRLAGTHERCNRVDDALRWHCRSLAVAAQAEDPLALGLARCFAGGYQLSLFNLTDAATLCEQAWQLLQDLSGSCAWSCAAVNWMMVHVRRQQPALARRLIALPRV